MARVPEPLGETVSATARPRGCSILLGSAAVLFTLFVLWAVSIPSLMRARVGVHLPPPRPPAPAAADWPGAPGLQAESYARIAAAVEWWRLLGYENRLLRAEDFRDDGKDGGEMGPGHGVTALYELRPPGEAETTAALPLRYQQAAAASSLSGAGELGHVQVRFQPPQGGASRVLDHVIGAAAPGEPSSEREAAFAAAVAEFGLLLRRSEHRGVASYEQVLELARPGLAHDPHGDRAAFLELVEAARKLDRAQPASRPADGATPAGPIG